MLVTEAQIEMQKSFERKQINGGLKRLTDQTKKLEDQSYASATCYGNASIDSLLPQFIESINNKKEERLKVATGYQRGLLNEYVLKLDPESAAAITLKLTFDKVFSSKKKEKTVANITESIGRAIEAELQMRHYESTAPGLFKVLKENYWHQSKGTEYKRKAMQTVISKCDIEQWKHWSSIYYVKVGGWYLDCLCESSGWFSTYDEYSRKRTDKYLFATDTFSKFKDEVVKLAELFSPLSWPMLIPPRDWTHDEDGGYYLNALTRCYEMVRRGPPLPIQGKTPYEFLNKIQKVKYRLNPFTIKVSKALNEKGIPVGKFRPIINHDIPPKPFDIATNDVARKEWKSKAKDANNANANEFRTSCRTRMTMNCIDEFEDKEYYIPWSFDYRGRVYPLPSFLSVQDTDWGKSLIRFADEAEITDDGKEWLAFQVATTSGQDKATIQERLAWPFIPENRARIERVATDPLGNIGDWENADEPWQFLAACEEFYMVVLTQSRTTTGLCVATDATCSGIQILAGMARDKATAAMVNVLPSEKPQDVYKLIAEKSLPNIPEKVRPHWDRKCTKRTVMTIPYNAKPFSNRSYIREALKEKGVEIDKDELTEIVKAVRGAMEIVVPGPMRVMRWIEKEVTKAIKNGSTQLVWKTPSGFRVTQRLMKKNTKTIELKLLGRCRVKVANGEKGVDLAHHKNATAPNLIHSLDASLLHISATKFNAPIALIHDSVLCRATDMSTLSHIVRDTYMHLFAEHDVLQDFADAIGSESEPPIIGDLQPESVIESTYFFC